MKQKWYILNISGSPAEQESRERVYLAAARKLRLPLIVEHNAAPTDAKDTSGEPFYGPTEIAPDDWWSLAWCSSHPPRNLKSFWNTVDQLSLGSNEHARQSLVSS